MNWNLDLQSTETCIFWIIVICQNKRLCMYLHIRNLVDYSLIQQTTQTASSKMPKGAMVFQWNVHVAGY